VREVGEFQNTMERVPNIKNDNIKSMQGCMVCECGHGYWHIGLNSLNVELHLEKFGMLK
jgi:hypothetical protein